MLTVLLTMIGVLGLGAGVWSIWAAMTTPHHNAIEVATALATGSIPFTIGVIALGAVAVVLAVERSGLDQVYAINRLSDIVIKLVEQAEDVEPLPRSGEKSAQDPTVEPGS